ncbi:MAG: hypothetical protein ACM3KR_01935 [Deltaproteobacteria bacterium]
MFLERFYIYKNRNVLIEISKKISEEYSNDRNNISNFISQIDKGDGISCTITDKNMDAKFKWRYDIH